MIKSYSPQAPSELVAEVEAVSPAFVAEAAIRLRQAQQDWWRAAPAFRAAGLAQAAARLKARAGEAATLVMREVGKPIAEATGEVARAVSILEFYAQACYAPLGDTLPASGLMFTQRRPHGVAGLITPWNFPLAIPLWKAAPALAAGNAVLLKPSPDAIGCAGMLGEILAGLPFELVPGDGETGSAVVAASDVLSFTGSVVIGQQVVASAAARGIPVQAEMGGQNAAIVLPDADLERTAAMLAGAMMGYAGQKCTATRRVIAVGDPGPLTAALVEAVRELGVGDPADSTVAVGPVINERAHRVVRDAAAGALHSGARLLTGGEGEGYLIRPMLVDGVDPAHRLVQTETFGPLAAILSASDLPSAVELANGVPHGLVTSIHGSDLTQVLAAVEGVDTGLIRVNLPTTGVDFYAPFGGTKASSYGQREQGLAGLEFYSATRTITLAGA